MKDVEEIRKNYQSTLLTFLVLDLLGLVIYCVFQFSIVGIISSIFWSILLFVGYKKAKKREESAWIVGIVTAISMVPALILAPGFIITLIFFLIILIDSLKYKKSFKE